MKKMTGFIFLLLLTKFSISQHITPDTAAKISLEQQTKKMGELLLKQDYKEFLKYTYPKIIEMGGGQNNMAAAIKKGMDDMAKQGLSLTDLQVGAPSDFILYKNELQTVLEQTLEMKTISGNVIKKSSLIGISPDKGKRWYFVDTQGKDISTLRKILPNLSPDLIIPLKTAPTIINY